MSRMDSLETRSSLKFSKFTGKLWHLVNDPEVGSVCWDASGEGILIYEQAFKAEVLMPQTRKVNAYFKTTCFRSFVRQLHLYGFRKLHPNLDISGQQHGGFDMAQPHHFYNPQFKRENPELVGTLKRLTPANKAKLRAASPLTRPTCSNCAISTSQQENSAVMREGSVLVGQQGTLSPVSSHTDENVPESELHNDVQ
ncbi:heat shock factor protein 5-like [Tachysurus fulvidraco]|uniref:heat shock factor protein 5-like n=1 Tax=Tachysurus fulvidraco TaxID=1234273 RepID=UPI001FEE0FAD|nr:heat shock factor protein 5-like [Tachysurus fulvidraco]